MRVLLANRKPGQIEYGIIYGGAALAALAAVRLLPVLPFVPQCPFRTLTGLPCPTCGATRSLIHLAHGDIIDALMMNPLAAGGVLVAVFLFFYGIAALLFHIPRFGFLFTENESKAVRAGFASLLFAQWIYLVVRLS